MTTPKCKPSLHQFHFCMCEICHWVVGYSSADNMNEIQSQKIEQSAITYWAYPQPSASN